MTARVVLNEFGYYELAEMPSPTELKTYYAEKYYQNPQGTYSPSYSEAEIAYCRNKITQKLILTGPYLRLRTGHAPRFLDVGAGEGWALAYFASQGWECVGLDYSGFGCASQNPEAAACLKVGDVYENLRVLRSDGAQFDLILLDNVLEHVLDPRGLLNDLHAMLAEGGALIIEVPNDFSRLHEHLRSNRHIDRPFWVAAPDHISYFGAAGLTALARASGWAVQDMVGDYPIDLCLLNPLTNYVMDRSVGKACHTARVEAENLLHSISPEKSVAFYRALADLGLGRTLTVVLTSNQAT